MKKILLAGATGHLGKHIFRELKLKEYEVRVLARSIIKAKSLFPDPNEVVLADATKLASLEGCCEGVEVVISSLGKSVSLRHQGNGSFHDIDYIANLNLLEEAKRSGVKQFIYISAFGADKFPGLAYFKAHADFENALVQSGLSYTILQPVALFSAFEEMMNLARRGRFGQLDIGEKLVNPVYDGDVAKIAVDNIGQPSQKIPLGGPCTYTRQELTQMVCEAAGYTGGFPKIPFEYVDTLLPFVRLLSRSLYDKLAFMVAVSKVDCIAPAIGEHSLEAYFELEPALSS